MKIAEIGNINESALSPELENICELFIEAVSDFPEYGLDDLYVLEKRIKRLLGGPITEDAIDQYLKDRLDYSTEEAIWIRSSLESFADGLKLLHAQGMSWSTFVAKLDALIAVGGDGPSK